MDCRWTGLVAVLLFTSKVLASEGLDDDLQFDESVAESVVQLSSHTTSPVRRKWGVPDYQATVGKLFKATIPKDAFSGDIEYFEPVAAKNRAWPQWLKMSRTGELKGVASSEDVGAHYLMVRAVGPHAHHYSKDIFAVEVVKPGLGTQPSDTSDKKQCGPGVDPLMTTILMDLEFHLISPARRVSMIETMAGYFGVSQDIFYLRELSTPREILSLADATVVMSGPGNANSVKDKEFASLAFQVGCGREVWREMMSVMERVGADARDGTLAEVLQAPILGWHTRNELPTFFRDRREVGSGDMYGNDDEEDYGEPLTTMANPHPHRHHHGEEGEQEDLNSGTIGGPEAELEPSEVFYQRPSTSLQYENIIATPAFIPERPTAITESSVTVVPTRVTDINFSSQPIFDSSDPYVETLSPVTVPLVPSSSDSNVTDLETVTTSDGSSPTQPLNTPNSVASSSSASHDTTLPEFASTNTSQTWTIVETTEENEPEARNFPPTIRHRLKKMVVTAGKVLRYQVPENTFHDVEDGTTSHMTLSFYSSQGKPTANSWIAFNEKTREIVALPLENEVSRWEFSVEAKDKDGDHISDVFELQVQQHKLTRTVNHEVTLSLSVARDTFPLAIDWQLRVLDALIKVYNDPDASLITVRAVSQTSDPYSFTFTNDSLTRSPCPREEIEQLLKVISQNEDGYPSSILQDALGTGITVRRVTYRGLQNCETKVTSALPPEVPINQFNQSTTNYAPVPRNQIDQINVVAGRLLVYKVPEDTFYDPEDGGTRKLKMTLLNMDRSPLKPENWLQFDSKNQEFYGLPLDSDVGEGEYQLICEDRGSLTASDGLMVKVAPRVSRRYNVEFHIALDLIQKNFSPFLRRKFVEKLQELFGDVSTDSVVVQDITGSDSTIITWFNASLPTDYCADSEIHRLRQVLAEDHRAMTERLVAVMGAELPVISVGLDPAGACQGRDTVQRKPDPPPLPPSDDSHPMGVTDDYIITYIIPSAVIAIMLILAGLIACLFYRKRRASKMGISAEDERQSFRNKGIPVIFQDELEEKPEPENKNPVIMKEEKPPLPPPEYQRVPTEDTPYHPPPPFPSSRDNARHSRPKPTPTYRKPPPYVPP